MKQFAFHSVISLKTALLTHASKSKIQDSNKYITDIERNDYITL